MAAKKFKQVEQTINVERIDQTNTLGTVDGKFKQIYYILIAVILVLVLGFITLLVTVAGLGFAYMHDSQDVYTQARNATEVQNDKIKQLSEKLEELTKTIQNGQNNKQIAN